MNRYGPLDEVAPLLIVNQTLDFPLNKRYAAYRQCPATSDKASIRPARQR